MRIGYFGSVKAYYQAKTGRVGCRRSRAGQVTTEYAVLTGLLLGTLLVLAVFLYAFKEFGGRILDLIACDYL
jgi:hypothetical protein